MTITSNDPVNPTTRIHISADINILFDFEVRGIDFGEVKVDTPVTKSVFIDIKDPATTKITGLSATLPNIEVKEGEATAEPDGSSKVEIDVTLIPGIIPGYIRDIVTARSNLGSKPEATLRVSGKVLGEIETIPEALRFDRNPIPGEQTSGTQKLQVVNRYPEKPFHILTAEDPDHRLKIDFKTLKEGQRYEVEASLIEDSLPTGNYYHGAIYVTTDNPKQDTVKVEYNIYGH